MWFDNLLQLKVFDFLRCRREMFTHLPFSCMSASIYSQYVCALHISDSFKWPQLLILKSLRTCPSGDL